MAEANPLRGLISNISLVGTDDEIKTQLSLLLGIAQIQEAQFKGLDIDFLKWIDAFENGFNAGFAPRQDKKLAAYWGQTQKTRPRVRILNESKKDWEKQGYYLIEFQPDRSIEEESYVLFGTPKELINKLMDWMNFHIKMKNAFNLDLDEVIGAIEREPETFKPQGHPKIKLIFLENSFKFASRIARNPKSTRGRAQISFRLMDKTNDSITTTEVVSLANKIKAKFLNPIFKFTKGKEFYKYNDLKLGEPLLCWTLNQVEAQKLFGQVLDLINDSPDIEKIIKRITLNPAKTYDDTPKDRVILGKPRQVDKVRPVVEVEFNSAYLHMEGLRKPIYLVDRSYRRQTLAS